MKYSKYSLICVSNQSGDKVDGSWLQNHVGTLSTATERARQIEETNSNKIDVAVVAEVPSPVPMLNHWYYMKRLDTQPE